PAVDTEVRSTVPDATGPRLHGRGRGSVRRTAAMITAGALILLAGCTGDDAGGGSKDTAAEAPAAQLSLAMADGSADVSPVVPLEISVTDGDLADVTLVDDAGTEVP